MSFALSDWLLYTMWGVFGLMIIDFLIGFFQSFWKGSFTPSIVINYLKDIIYLVLPLNILISLFPIDPSGWILVTFYFIGGLGVILKYLMDIKGKFSK
ncbi:hypothetical protein ABE288_27650 [Bacillus salipaludis]|uniref:hypothetical protein n=1 Tax=Bacillus salipaludis TaxID=2547811 RepID=UPI003D239226